MHNEIDNLLLYGSVSPTARIPPPPAFVGHLSFFKKKMLQMPHGGASTFIQIPTVGPREECLYPTHGTRPKFYLVIEAKKKYSHSFQWFFSWFLKHYFVLNYNCNALQNRF